MRTPHTHYTKGKTVWIKLRNGTEVVGKFQERRGRFVVLDSGKVDTRNIRAMNRRRLNPSSDPSVSVDK